MKIYAVVEDIEESFDNELCWEDGYYDDYYETKVNYIDYLGFFSNKKEAEKCEKYLEERDHFVRVIEINVDKKFNEREFLNEN